MSEVRVLDADEVMRFAALAVNAYPGMETPSADDLGRRLLQGQADDPSVQLYGLFRDGQLLGGMRLFDFIMQLHTIRAPVGGVGLVAVDLLHKKEQVAKELIAAFLRHYRAQGTTLVTLYPFRPDFYRNMGFGYGAPLYRYRVKPANLPLGPGKEAVRFLGPDDIDALRACYHRVCARTHGMLDRALAVSRRILTNPATRTVGVAHEGQVLAYATFTFKRGSTFIHNDIEISELVYENSTALHALFAFLHTQADQINEIVFDLQDETFYQLLTDPRNGTGHLLPSVYHESSTVGVGLLYRVIDTPGFFRLLSQHSFGAQSITLRLVVHDSFMPEWSTNTCIQFTNGRPQLRSEGRADGEIALSIADFSSLVMGSIDFDTLYRYGMATISEPTLVPTVSRLFRVERKPICLTHF